MMTESRRKSRGFSLVEIAIVLLILGFVLTIGLQATGAYLSQERRKVSLARVAGLDVALANYVAVQGRLPCPADGSLATGVALAGVEARTAATGVCTAMATGVVPWVTLGLTENEALDGWNTRISYRTVPAVAVPPAATNLGFTSNRALDATNCDPGGTAVRALLALGAPPQSVETCAAACTLATLANCTSPTNFMTGRGLNVRDNVAPAGTLLMDPAAGTGAAYVLISHGENRGGGYDSAGTLQAGTPANGVLEAPNANNQALPVLPAAFIDAPFNDSDGAARFDDIVSRPTLMTLLTRAQLAPRAH